MHNVAENSAQNLAPKLLATKIAEILETAGHPRPSDWVSGLHPDALNPATPEDVQRFLINRYWHLQLGTVTTESTMDVRYCLVPQGSIDRWLELFAQMVAPCIVRNDLPLPAVTH